MKKFTICVAVLSFMSSLSLSFAEVGTQKTTGYYKGTVENRCIVINDLDSDNGGIALKPAGVVDEFGFETKLSATDLFQIQSNLPCTATVSEKLDANAGPAVADCLYNKDNIASAQGKDTYIYQPTYMTQSRGQGVIEATVNAPAGGYLAAGAYQVTCTVNLTF